MRYNSSTNKIKILKHWKWYFLSFWAIISIFVLSHMPCNAANEEHKNAATKKELMSNAEKKWGILPLSIQLTAAGQLLDYRFLVIDPEKAVSLMKRGDKAYLIDQASGIKVTVPRTKVGPLRQTGSKPVAGKVYPILFVNSGGVIKAGNKVTLVMGELRIEDIVVGKEISPRPALTQAKRAKWNKMQKMIRQERANCIDGCEKDRTCSAKCETAYKSQLYKEYQKLVNE